MSDRTSLGTYEYDVRTSQVTLSASLRQIAGVADARPLPADAFFQLLHPDDRARVGSATKPSPGVTPPPTLCRFQHDGQIRWTVLRAEPVRAADGTLQRVVGLVFDTTWGHEAYRKVLTAMGTPNADAAVLHDAPVALAVCAADRVLDVNAAFGQLTGYSRDDATGPMAPNVWERLRLGEVAAAPSLGATFGDQVWRIRARDGHSRLVLVSAGAIVYQGRAAVLVAFNEASMRFDTQSLLAEREERTSRLTAAPSEGLVFLDEHHIVVDCNEHAAVLLGLTAESLRGQPLLSLKEPDAREAFDAWLRQPSSAPRLVQLRHRDGSLRPFEAQVRPMDGRDRRLRVVVLRDGTERQRRAQAEAKVHSLSEQLAHAQRLEAIGRLAGGVAHDFNNLLMVINGHAEQLLRRLPDDHELRPRVSAIASAGQRGTELTRRLLAFSRRQVLTPKLVQANDLAGALKAMVTPLLGDRIQFSLTFDPTAGSVHVDPGQIEQVILNLASNARDAMPDGGTLSIETRVVNVGRDAERLAPGRYVEIAVRDTGTGIGPDQMPHIFEPFFTTKARGKGTGLGLAMAYGVVVQSGGDIVVESVVGQGTTMRVRLPQAAEAAAIALPGPAPEEAAPGGTETILLVEDDDTVRELVTEFLRGAGYRVIVARGAEEAMIASGRPDARLDLLVSDVMMPGVDGPTLAARLRQSRPGLRTLLISGYPGSADVHAESGTAFLSKPFSRAALLKKVREVLT